MQRRAEVRQLGATGAEFLCRNVTTLPPDLTHLDPAALGIIRKLPGGIVCHLQLISSSRLQER